MKKSWRIFLGILAFLVFLLFVSCLIYQIVTTRKAHQTFEGYCHWRGLEVVNKSADYGFCADKYGNEFKIVSFNGKWYLNGDLPWGAKSI
jgi:hypothetical protein